MKYDIIFIIANDAIDAKAMTGKTYSQDDTVCVIMDNKDKTYVGFSDTDLKDGKLITGCSEKEAAKNMLADNSSQASAVIIVNCTTRTPVLPCPECVSMILEMNELNKNTLLITPDKTYIRLTDADKFKPGEDNSELEADDVIGETDPLVIATPMNGNGLTKSVNLTENAEENEDNTVPFYHEPIPRESQNYSEQIADTNNNSELKKDNSLKTRSVILNSQEMLQQEEEPQEVKPQYYDSQYIQNGNANMYYNPQYIQQDPQQQYSAPVSYPINGQYVQQPLNSQFSNSQYSNSQYTQQEQQQYSVPVSYQMNGQYMQQPVNSQYINSSQYGNNSGYSSQQYMQQPYMQQYMNSGNIQSANSSLYINSPYMNQNMNQNMNQMSQNYMQSGMMQSQYGQRYMNSGFYPQSAPQRFIPNTNTDTDDEEDDLIQGKLNQLLGGKK